MALKGVVQPIYHRGKKVGERVEYDSKMLRFLLRAARPTIYRDHGDLLDGIDLTTLTPEQRERLHVLAQEILGLTGSPRPTFS